MRLAGVKRESVAAVLQGETVEINAAFIALKRAVYQTIDERRRIKHAINGLLGSGLIEESNTSHIPGGAGHGAPCQTPGVPVVERDCCGFRPARIAVTD